MAQLFHLPREFLINANVELLANAKAYFYETNTANALDTFTTDALNVAHTNPVEADAFGVFPAIYLDPAKRYKLTLNTSAGALIYTQDPVNDSFTAGQIGAILYPRTTAEIGEGVTPTNYAYPAGDIRRYGAVGDDATDNGTAITNAIAVAENAGGEIYIPAGIFRFGSTLTFTGSSNAVTLRGASRERSILRKAFSGTGIDLTANAVPTLENFTLDRTGTDAGVGIKITQAAEQTTLRNLVVGTSAHGHGSHGIEIISCNNIFVHNVQTTFNGGDGIKLNGTATPNVNAGSYVNIDTRGNTGWGFNIDNGWANFAYGIIAQQNTAGGIRLNNARQSSLHLYSEANTGPNISLIDTADCQGNFLTILEGYPTYGGTTATRNTVLHMKRGAVYDSNFNKITTDLIRIENGQQSGATPLGTLEINHPTNDLYNIAIADGSATATIDIANGAGATIVQTDGYFRAALGLYPSSAASVGVFAGSGAPENALAAGIGSLYLRTDGGVNTSLYIKQSGTGNTGWAAVTP